MNTFTAIRNQETRHERNFRLATSTSISTFADVKWLASNITVESLTVVASEGRNWKRFDFSLFGTGITPFYFGNACLMTKTDKNVKSALFTVLGLNKKQTVELLTALVERKGILKAFESTAKLITGEDLEQLVELHHDFLEEILGSEVFSGIYIAHKNKAAKIRFNSLSSILTAFIG